MNKTSHDYLKSLKRRFLIPMTLVFAALLFSCSEEPTSETAITFPEITQTSFSSAAEVVDLMGTGFNLGNTFDYNLQSTNPASIYPIIDQYYGVGMRHIRIPVTWMDGFGGNTLADAGGNINFSHARFTQLQSVIDYAINKKMFVILNAHHEHWLNESYDGSTPYNDAFANLWTGIANNFKDYSHLLIFEVLNEPQGVFGDWSGGANPISTAALALTRQINEVGYDAIRLTGGLNSNRVIMVSTNGMGNHSQLDEVYPSLSSLPGMGEDKFLAFQVHTYDPWAFCGQTGSNAAWPGSKAIANSLRFVSKHAKALNVPVNYGEFGVGRDANAAERNSNIVREYYRTMRLTCLSEKMSATVWDDRGWFGLVNRDGSSFIHNIVPTMMAP